MHHTRGGSSLTAVAKHVSIWPGKRGISPGVNPTPPSNSLEEQQAQQGTFGSGPRAPLPFHPQLSALQPGGGTQSPTGHSGFWKRKVLGEHLEAWRKWLREVGCRDYPSHGRQREQRSIHPAGPGPSALSPQRGKGLHNSPSRNTNLREEGQAEASSV